MAAIAITDVTVIDVASAAARPHMTVLIDGDHIRAVGRAIPIPPNTRLVPGTGKFLIPGLWDMHVHLWYQENQLPTFLAFGVTGVQDMGSDFARVSAWRAAIESGKAIGPRIVTPGPPVTEKPSGDPKLPTLVARTPEEARAAFDQLWDMDVDFVKVLDGLSRDAYLALAEQARHWHMRLEGHIPRSVTAWDAINARQRSLEHLFGVMKSVSTDDEALDLFEKCALNGVRITPTLVLWQRMAHTIDNQLKTDPRLKYVPESIRKTWPDLKEEDDEPYKKQIESIYRLTGLATRTRVEILAGTDTGDPYTIPGATLHAELEQLVRAGLTPHQALAAATIAPARFFEQDETLGSIENGKQADLVLLTANPLDDIRNTTKVSAVFSRGKYYPRATLDRILAMVREVPAAQMRSTRTSVVR
jgi:imidazolonepropionase-like amidohydrolase